ncbi:gephyrin-like molybdotransferase receptor GlpR [Nocardia sp. NPDC050710]|uniref:divisome protein SepX/GlpR n=1 Tax=Nocardia sp. NPDC050710 TaxID=3157220 RepID=UPI0033E804ED
MPNSILWIGLVVLWVFVLFPILADRHPRIRQTTDAALATRVLHRGGSKRRTKKGPAAGHDSDPDYRPTRVQRKLSHSDHAEDRMTTPADDQVTEADQEPGTVPALEAGDNPSDTAASDADITETELDDSAENDSDDTDSDETDIATAGTAAQTDDPADDDDVADEHTTATAARIPPAHSAAPARVTDTDPESDSDDQEFVPTRRGRGGYDPEADAIARAARYTFRQRAVLGLVLATILSGALGVVINALLWWACGLTAVVLVTYLAYLRKQVRMEEDIRRRRAARLTRGQRDEYADDDSRHAEQQARRAMDRDTARALRRRSVLLEPDDEDPMFENLETFDPATARALRRGTGGDMRRAAGA